MSLYQAETIYPFLKEGAIAKFLSRFRGNVQIVTGNIDRSTMPYIDLYYDSVLGFTEYGKIAFIVVTGTIVQVPYDEKFSNSSGHTWQGRRGKRIGDFIEELGNYDYIVLIEFGIYSFGPEERWCKLTIETRE